VQQNHDAGNIVTPRDNFLDNSQNLLTFIPVVSHLKDFSIQAIIWYGKTYQAAIEYFKMRV